MQKQKKKLPILKIRAFLECLDLSFNKKPIKNKCLQSGTSTIYRINLFNGENALLIYQTLRHK